MRARTNAVIMEALAGAHSYAPSLPEIVTDTIKAVTLACWDLALDPSDRLVLIDAALQLMAALKELTEAAQAARPGLIAAVSRRTDDMLRLYAQLVRIERTGTGR